MSGTLADYSGDSSEDRKLRLTEPDAWPCWLFSIVVVATAYEVGARYFFASPTLWATELSMFACAVAYMLSGIYVMRRDEHLRITIVYDISPPWLRRVFDLVQVVAMLGFLLGLAWFGYKGAWRALSNWELYGTHWNPPIPAVVRPIIVFSAVGMAFFALRNYLRSLKETS